MEMLEAIVNALSTFSLEPRDGATAVLAQKLAQEIDATDDPKLIGELGSRLLTVLISLGMTPGSRASAKTVEPMGNPTVLDELRARRKVT